MIKFAANSFAIFVSALFALYDFKAATDQFAKDKLLSVIYTLRGTAYFGLSLGYTKISIDFSEDWHCIRKTSPDSFL